MGPASPIALAAGAALFARYAYPPNARGLCGPGDAEELFGYVTTGTVDPGLTERARAFEGAWPYLELIAAANGRRDPLDPAVVRGYWLGTDAAAAVGLRALADHVDERFRRRSGGGWQHLADRLVPGAVPDHTFHVVAVYPWVGMLRDGVVEPARTIVESCLIRPGRVLQVDGDRAQVRVPTLRWEQDRLRPGPAQPSTLRWRRDGQGIVDDLRPGDRVAVHWDWVCDRLDPAGEQALRRSLRRGLGLL